MLESQEGRWDMGQGAQIIIIGIQWALNRQGGGSGGVGHRGFCVKAGRRWWIGQGAGDRRDLGGMDLLMERVGEARAAGPG